MTERPPLTIAEVHARAAVIARERGDPEAARMIAHGDLPTSNRTVKRKPVVQRAYAAIASAAADLREERRQ